MNLDMINSVRPPDNKSVSGWYKQVREIGSVDKRHSVERSGRHDEDVDCVRQAFRVQRSQSFYQV